MSDLELGLRGLLKSLMLPPGGLLLLLLFALLLGRRAIARTLLWLTLALLYLASIPATGNWLAPQVERYPALSETQAQTAGADAILVFLAGYHAPAIEFGNAHIPSGLSLERLSYAVHLYRATGLPIILSGGVLDPADPSVAEIARHWLESEHAIDKVLIETSSKTTRENAQFSAALIRQQGFRKVLLVTHAAHMARALDSAHAAGIDAIAAPAFFLSAPSNNPTNVRDWLPDPWAVGSNYFLLHEIVGSYWYRWTATRGADTTI